MQCFWLVLIEHFRTHAIKSPTVAIIPSVSKAVPLWLRYAVTGCETVGSDLLSFSRAGCKNPALFKMGMMFGSKNKVIGEMENELKERVCHCAA
jgi:hypothetical protein